MVSMLDSTMERLTTEAFCGCCLAGWSKFWGDDGYIKIHRGGNE